jgi:hypothetical protein
MSQDYVYKRGRHCCTCLLHSMLEKEMPAEETEVALKAWEAKLWPTYKNMEDALWEIQWGPDKDAFSQWQKENTKQNQFLADMKDDIVVLKWIMKEILRIVNPRNLEYKKWFGHSRRDFLVKIGKPNVEPGPPLRFWKPPAAQIGDIHIETLLCRLNEMKFDVV